MWEQRQSRAVRGGGGRICTHINVRTIDMHEENRSFVLLPHANRAWAICLIVIEGCRARSVGTARLSSEMRKVIGAVSAAVGDDEGDDHDYYDGIERGQQGELTGIISSEVDSVRSRKRSFVHPRDLKMRG